MMPIIPQHKSILLIVSSLLILLVVSCSDEEFIPKPRGYYKVELPKRNYTKFSDASFPYKFEYPSYGKVVRDTSFFGDRPENPFWINVEFEKLGGKIYLTYKTVNNKSDLQKLLEDNYKMSYAHSKKADYIEDATFSTPNKVSGLLSHVGGDAASTYQFFATDSNKHFLRGALYFDAVPNADSLKPITEFLKKDLTHLIETLEWTR